MSTTLVGVFDDSAQAQKASEKLQERGIDQQSIQMSQRQSSTLPLEEEQGVIARFFSELFGDGDSDDYSEAMRRGNCVVAVKVADESRIEEVSDILEECGPVGLDERVQEWKATGYVPPVASRPLPQRQQTSSTPQGGEPLQAVEEELKIGKRTVQKGRVRVHTSMNERPVEEQVSLRDEKASIERKKVDRPASEADLQTAFEDATIEIRETSEEAVVSKTARVVEEVRIGKQSTERQQTVKGSVRSTKIDVDNLDDMPKGLRYSGAERRFSSAKYGGNERRVSH